MQLLTISLKPLIWGWIRTRNTRFNRALKFTNISLGKLQRSATTPTMWSVGEAFVQIEEALQSENLPLRRFCENSCLKVCIVPILAVRVWHWFFLVKFTPTCWCLLFLKPVFHVIKVVDSWHGCVSLWHMPAGLEIIWLWTFIYVSVCR